jgi:hypothetical protein
MHCIIRVCTKHVLHLHFKPYTCGEKNLIIVAVEPIEMKDFKSNNTYHFIVQYRNQKNNQKYIIEY